MPEWAVTHDDLRHKIASASIDSGFSSRVSQSFQMPANIVEVRVVCDTVDSVVSRGGILTFARPALALDSGQYVASSKP